MSLSGFLLPTKIPLSRLMSSDLSMGNHGEGQWLPPEDTSLQLISHKTWCTTTCLWFFQQQLQIFCLAQKSIFPSTVVMINVTSGRSPFMMVCHPLQSHGSSTSLNIT
ncbi:hypothetical protein GLYMA_10G102700v4 [Glycine max]|nr:hypothetical protein GLYMA_10G102700v4 [Glycine max]KAH1137598.1 hypothetical protein GYH30_027556 [Glycine max]